MFQQLSGKAAATIVGRVEAAIDSRRLHAATLARIDDAGLRAGLNVCNGQVTHPQVAASLGRKYLPAITQLS